MYHLVYTKEKYLLNYPLLDTASMTQLLMRLNPKDEFKIKLLKEKYGYNKTSELIRYLVNSKLEEWIKEEEKNQPQQPQKIPSVTFDSISQ